MGKKRPIFFSDIVDGAGRGISKTFNAIGRGCKATWNVYSGNAWHNKTGRDDHKLPFGGYLEITIEGGVTVAGIAGVVTGFATGGDWGTTMEVAAYAFGGVAALPPVVNHGVGIYTLSKQKKEKYLEEEKRFMLEHKKDTPKLT